MAYLVYDCIYYEKVEETKGQTYINIEKKEISTGILIS